MFPRLWGGVSNWFVGELEGQHRSKDSRGLQQLSSNEIPLVERRCLLGVEMHLDLRAVHVQHVFKSITLILTNKIFYRIFFQHSHKFSIGKSWGKGFGGVTPPPDFSIF